MATVNKQTGSVCGLWIPIQAPPFNWDCSSTITTIGWKQLLTVNQMHSSRMAENEWETHNTNVGTQPTLNKLGNKQRLLVQWCLQGNGGICLLWSKERGRICCSLFLYVFALQNRPVLCPAFFIIPAWFGTPIYPLGPFTYWEFHCLVNAIRRLCGSRGGNRG